jgi:glycosyltransferase involved in cell wall biosynthesis
VKVLVATDAWHPQVNGVVRTLEKTADAAAKLGATIEILSPDGFPSLPLPSYPEIRLALAPPSRIERRILDAGADFIHIATEGPIGLLTRHVCLEKGRAFTTSYHTRFPEYLAARLPIPARLSYRWLRAFHNAGCGVMVSTASLERELEARRFGRLMRWSRGVDCELFRPHGVDVLGLPRPIFLTVGRIAVEKNIEAFLSLELPGSKVVVGAGPALASLGRRFPAVCFLGTRQGEALAQIYASADVFVFPSLTDTFGIVLLEAMASGLPVAAFPVTGPLDIIGGRGVGVLDTDLRAAALACLTISRAACRAEAMKYGWEASARQFLDNLQIACASGVEHRAA